MDRARSASRRSRVGGLDLERVAAEEVARRAEQIDGRKYVVTFGTELGERLKSDPAIIAEARRRLSERKRIAGDVATD